MGRHQELVWTSFPQAPRLLVQGPAGRPGVSRLALPELQDAASARCCADLGLKTRICLAHLARWPLSPGIRETEIGCLPRCSLSSVARGSQSALGLRRRLSGLQHPVPLTSTQDVFLI